MYNSGQRRKLLNFKGFSRKVIVLVPNEENWKERLELRKVAEGDDVPESVILEMKGRLQGTYLEGGAGAIVGAFPVEYQGG